MADSEADVEFTSSETEFTAEFDCVVWPVSVLEIDPGRRVVEVNGVLIRLTDAYEAD